MGKTVAAQAQALLETISRRLGELADELLDRPEFGSVEWLAQAERLRNDEPAKKAWQLEWHLAKIEISREAKIDPLGDVINARKNGATWQNVADAYGVSRQRAHERWAEFDVSER